MSVHAADARQVPDADQLLDDLNPQHNPALSDLFLQRRLRAAELVEFARSLVAGVRRNRTELALPDGHALPP